MSRCTVLFAIGFLTQACVTGEIQMDQARYLAELDEAKTLIGPEWPLPPDVRLTTSGDVYMANLDGLIASLEQQLRRRTDDSLVARLARTRYHRFQITGLLADAEQARSRLSDAYDRTHGPAIDLSYAEVLMGFHEFQLAQEVLQTALGNGADPDQVLVINDRINRATGAAVSGPVNGNPVTLVSRANELVDRGQVLGASRLLKEAQGRYSDTAPYVLAWIQVQQGIVFLRYRDYSSARLFFAAARDRLPQYALATEHLAETESALGNHRFAAELYRSVASQTGNPEFMHQRAIIERLLGNDAAAERLAQRARNGYVMLLEKYPLMYADHGARYYLSVGDTPTALRLAQMNIDKRQDLGARILLLETHRSPSNIAAACAQLRALRQAGFASPELLYLAQDMREECGHQ